MFVYVMCMRVLSCITRRHISYNKGAASHTAYRVLYRALSLTVSLIFRVQKMALN